MSKGTNVDSNVPSNFTWLQIFVFDFTIFIIIEFVIRDVFYFLSIKK